VTLRETIPTEIASSLNQDRVEQTGGMNIATKLFMRILFLQPAVSLRSHFAHSWAPNVPPKWLRGHKGTNIHTLLHRIGREDQQTKGDGITEARRSSSFLRSVSNWSMSVDHRSRRWWAGKRKDFNIL